MTARSWLLRLINFVIILALCSSVFAIVEDFEDVSDWTCEGDCITFTASTDFVKEGSNSGKLYTDEFVDGLSITYKDISSTDYSSYDNISFFYYLDTADFAWDYINFALYEGGTACDEIEVETFVDEAWTEIALTSLGTCNAVTRIFIQIDSEAMVVAPVYVYWDYLEVYPLPTDSCTPPGSGDWTITDNDVCECSSSVTITGDLILNTGTLNVNNGCVLTIQGGEAYLYSTSTLNIYSGGQING